MAPESENDLRLEIGHVLFIDLVGYSKLLIEEQKEHLGHLTNIVLATSQVARSTNEQLVRLPTGDGMALVFRNSSEEPARCALEIAQALKTHPEIAVRMGVHSGPVSDVADVSGRSNIAGAGINMAQRVMDCGDAGHILLSRHVAEDLEQYGHWQPHLHNLGDCEVKHGVRLGVVNLYRDGVGNPQLPKKFHALKQHRSRIRWAEITAALLLLAAVVAAFLIVSRKPMRSAVVAAPEKSIAVLPFENLSSDKENAYFTDGVQDEILTNLAKIADLKVISRMSVMQYKSGAPRNLREIGQQLGVAHVLEGSVQRAGNRVRVNAQLIDARTDRHLWAQTYDRDLADVFAIQSEIAKAIADQLQAKLSPNEKKAIEQPPTANMAAYTAYLRGLGIEHSQSSGTSFEDAAAAYAEAVKLDPDFALAWARLSVVRAFLYYNSVDRSVNSAAAVQDAADRAMALAPQLGEAWLARGTYRMRVLNDPLGTVEAYREAERRLPNSALVYEYMAYAERRLNRWQDAEAHLIKATELDPRNTRLWTRLADDILAPLGRAAEAQAALDRALEIAPNDEFAVVLKVEHYQEEGELDKAAKELARIPEDSTDKTVLIHRVDQALLERNFDQAIFWAQKATSSPSPGQPLNPQDIFALTLQGYCERWAGRNDEAHATFERVIQELAPGGVLRTPPLLGARLFLALAYAGIGEKANALEQARQGVADYDNDALMKPLVETYRARVLAQLGDVDAAILALPHLLQMPGGIRPGNLRFSPYWDPLRKDPRFETLLKNPPPVSY